MRLYFKTSDGRSFEGEWQGESPPSADVGKKIVETWVKANPLPKAKAQPKQTEKVVQPPAMKKTAVQPIAPTDTSPMGWLEKEAGITPRARISKTEANTALNASRLAQLQAKPAPKMGAVEQTVGITPRAMVAQAKTQADYQAKVKANTQKMVKAGEAKMWADALKAAESFDPNTPGFDEEKFAQQWANEKAKAFNISNVENKVYDTFRRNLLGVVTGNGYTQSDAGRKGLGMLAETLKEPMKMAGIGVEPESVLALLTFGALGKGRGLLEAADLLKSGGGVTKNWVGQLFGKGVAGRVGADAAARVAEEAALKALNEAKDALARSGEMAAGEAPRGRAFVENAGSGAWRQAMGPIEGQVSRSALEEAVRAAQSKYDSLQRIIETTGLINKQTAWGKVMQAVGKGKNPAAVWDRVGFGDQYRSAVARAAMESEERIPTMMWRKAGLGNRVQEAIGKVKGLISQEGMPNLLTASEASFREALDRITMNLTPQERRAVEDAAGAIRIDAQGKITVAEGGLPDVSSGAIKFRNALDARGKPIYRVRAIGGVGNAVPVEEPTPSVSSQEISTPMGTGAAEWWGVARTEDGKFAVTKNGQFVESDVYDTIKEASARMSELQSTGKFGPNTPTTGRKAETTAIGQQENIPVVQTPTETFKIRAAQEAARQSYTPEKAFAIINKYANSNAPMEFDEVATLAEHVNRLREQRRAILARIADNPLSADVNADEMVSRQLQHTLDTLRKNAGQETSRTFNVLRNLDLVDWTNPDEVVIQAKANMAKRNQNLSPEVEAEIRRTTEEYAQAVAKEPAVATKTSDEAIAKAEAKQANAVAKAKTSRKASVYKRLAAKIEEADPGAVTLAKQLWKEAKRGGGAMSDPTFVTGSKAFVAAYHYAKAAIQAGIRGVADITKLILTEVGDVPINDILDGIREAGRAIREGAEEVVITTPNGETYTVSIRNTVRATRPLTEEERAVAKAILETHDLPVASSRSTVAAANTRVMDRVSGAIEGIGAPGKMNWDSLSDEELRALLSQIQGISSTTRSLIKSMGYEEGSAGMAELVSRMKAVAQDLADGVITKEEAKARIANDPVVVSIANNNAAQSRAEASARSTVAAANSRVTDQIGKAIDNILKETPGRMNWDDLADQSLKDALNGVKSFDSRTRWIAKTLEINPGSEAYKELATYADNLMAQVKTGEMTIEEAKDLLRMHWAAKVAAEAKVAKAAEKAASTAMYKPDIMGISGALYAWRKSVAKEGITRSAEAARKAVMALSRIGGAEVSPTFLADALASGLSPELKNEVRYLVGELISKGHYVQKGVSEAGEPIMVLMVPKLEATSYTNRALSEAQYASIKLRVEAKALVESTVPGGGFGQMLGDTTDLMRSMLATADISAAMRQNALFFLNGLATKDAATVRDFATALDMSRNPELLDSFMRDFEGSTNGKLAMSSGLFLSRTEDITRSEEAFASRILKNADKAIEKNLPVVKQALGAAKKVRDWSELNYTAQLNLSRVRAWNNWLAAMGNDPRFISRADLETMAKAINAFTGRGEIGNAGDALRHIFFSPRFLASRMQVAVDTLTAIPGLAINLIGNAPKIFNGQEMQFWTPYGMVSPKAYAVIRGSQMKFGAMILGIAAGYKALGGEFGLDPGNSDTFLKGRIFLPGGQVATTDFSGGVGDAISLLYKLGTRAAGKPSGAVTALGPSYMLTPPTTQEPPSFNANWNMLTQFGRNRVTPALGLADMFTVEGRNRYTDQDIEEMTLWDWMKQTMIPLTFGDSIDVGRQYGWGPGFGVAFANAFGATTKFGDPKSLTLPAEDQVIIRAFYAKGDGGNPMFADPSQDSGATVAKTLDPKMRAQIYNKMSQAVRTVCENFRKANGIDTRMVSMLPFSNMTYDLIKRMPADYISQFTTDVNNAMRKARDNEIERIMGEDGKSKVEADAKAQREADKKARTKGVTRVLPPSSMP